MHIPQSRRKRFVSTSFPGLEKNFKLCASGVFFGQNYLPNKISKCAPQPPKKMSFSSNLLHFLEAALVVLAVFSSPDLSITHRELTASAIWCSCDLTLILTRWYKVKLVVPNDKQSLSSLKSCRTFSTHITSWCNQLSPNKHAKWLNVSALQGQFRAWKPENNYGCHKIFILLEVRMWSQFLTPGICFA